MTNIVSGRVTGRSTAINQDGSTPVLLLQVEVTDPADIQTIQMMSQAGDDTNPPDDARVVILSITDAFKVVIASDDGIEPTMDPGEKKLYSSAGGTIQAFINLLASGVIELNGNADNAVRFSALETQINQLVSDFNTHTHAVTTAPGTTAVPVPQSTVDITGARVDEVTLP